MAELIKIDRNGSKHWRGLVKCDRCGGDGIYKWGAVINGGSQYCGVCFKCNGAGVVTDTWIERTPEYQAKLDAKRKAKFEAWKAQMDAEDAIREAERKAKEEREEAERIAREEKKKISQFFGDVGQRITANVTYIGSPHFERKSFGGYGTETCYIHTFKDGLGNKIIWKTTSGIDLEEGAMATITGTVKDHVEYKDEKQTQIIRCKVASRHPGADQGNVKGGE